MSFAVKIIAGLLMAKGVILLFFPSFMYEAAINFSEISIKYKRIMGIVILIIGLAVFMLSRLELAVPIVHWVIAVAGIYIAMEGILLLIIPGVVDKILLWFFKEKGPISVIGSILMLFGLVIYFFVR